jgi:7-cyano-7-deazaguanine synthase
MNTQLKKAVILLSGGLDSATTLAYAVSKGFDCHAITFDYGQRHKIEIKAAKKVAKALGASRHLVIKIDLRKFGGSALTSEMPVPKGRSAKKIGEGIPGTYVPARNTVFLSLALAFAEAAGARDIFIGVNALDYSGYPDCRPEFIRAFEKTANLGTKAGVEGEKFKIHAPLIKLSKAEIVRLGRKLGVDFEMTHSCYDPAPDDGTPCGRCDSCLLREKGFKEA